MVVNDGSRDGTGSILARVQPGEPLLSVVTHPRNRGYGAALRTGIQKATEDGFEYALFMDSDLTNDPGDIPRFVERMRQSYDVIKATRYSQNGRVEGVPFHRVVISVVGNRVAHFLFRLPVYDCTNGFRAVRTSLLAKIQLTEDKFPIIMEELYWLKFLARSYAEVPVILKDRGKHQRPSSFVYRPRVFWNYLKYPLKAALGIRPKTVR
jgi:dolichol-phosphate mannosyltransferase